MPADFDWTFTPGTAVLTAILGVIGWGGRKWLRQQLDNSLKIDNTKKLQDLATDTVERIDARNMILEAKIDMMRDNRDELEAELTAVREYLLRDAAWHTQVIALVESLGGSVTAAPVLPPRQREVRHDPRDL